MKNIALCALTLLLATTTFAQAPPTDMKAVPIDAPAATNIPLIDGVADTEQWERYWGQEMVRNVTVPSIYPVLPSGTRRNGKAVIVIPGGGYQFVSMDNEGFGVANALAAAGYTAFILKYRPMATPRDPAEYMEYLAALFGTLGKGQLEDHPPAVDDLATAIRYVRANAEKWQVDPEQVGAVGFSAGSRTLIRLIEEKDEAAALDHVGLIYPPMVQTVAGGPRPPLFFAIAVDDPLFQQGGLNMLDKWLGESNDVEFHLYSGGSHGFGTRPLGTTSDHWIEQYLAWLELQ
jgi:acetyl esterase/lipase